MGNSKEREIVNILEKHKKNHGELISILEEIQKMFGYLPADALQILAAKTRRSLVDIYGVATFYKSFSLNPRGKHLVLVCLGTACHVRGAPRIVEEFERQLGIDSGNTTPDKEFTIETVNCLGACALGPTVVVDGHYFSHVTKKRVKDIIHKTLRGLDKINIKTDRRLFPLEVSCSVCGKSLMDPDYPMDGYPSIQLTINLEGRKSWLRLTSLYGSSNIASEHEIPFNKVSRFYCPHCRSELLSFSNCPECGTPMAAMSIHDGCIFEVCTRGGCRGHIY